MKNILADLLLPDHMQLKTQLADKKRFALPVGQRDQLVAIEEIEVQFSSHLV